MTTHVSNIERDGQTREFAGHGHAVLGSAGALSLMRGTFEPGWRWSVDVAPIAGTDTCRTRHLGFVLSGRMHVRADDGAETDIGPGDLFDLPAGHDAWVVGDEACVMIDVSSETTRYARPAEGRPAEDDAMRTARRGYAAFNAGDADTLREIMSHDVVHHVPGSGPLAGTKKGFEAVLGYYGQLGELTDGTFKAYPVSVCGDDQGHVSVLHQIVATRNGNTRVMRGTLVFTFLGDKVTDILELHEDLPGDDAFLAG